MARKFRLSEARNLAVRSSGGRDGRGLRRLRRRHAPKTYPLPPNCLKTCVGGIAASLPLVENYRARFGEHISSMRREDVKGFRRRQYGSPDSQDRGSPQEGRSSGTGDASFTKGHQAVLSRLRNCWAIRRERTQAPGSRRSGQENITPDIQRDRRRSAERMFVLQNCPARTSRPDGRFRVNHGPGFAAAFDYEKYS